MEEEGDVVDDGPREVREGGEYSARPHGLARVQVSAARDVPDARVHRAFTRGRHFTTRMERDETRKGKREGRGKQMPNPNPKP